MTIEVQQTGVLLAYLRNVTWLDVEFLFAVKTTGILWFDYRRHPYVPTCHSQNAVRKHCPEAAQRPEYREPGATLDRLGRRTPCQGMPELLNQSSAGPRLGVHAIRCE